MKNIYFDKDAKLLGMRLKYGKIVLIFCALLAVSLFLPFLSVGGAERAVGYVVCKILFRFERRKMSFYVDGVFGANRGNRFYLAFGFRFEK